MTEAAETTVETPAETTAETPAETTAEAKTNGSAWAYSGEGEAKLVDGKYASVEDLDKGYSELASKMGSFTGAPKDGYELKTPEGFEQSEPLMEAVKEIATEMNMSQDGLQKFMDSYIKAENEVTEAAVKAEMNKLGDSSEARCKDVEDRINSLFSKDPERANALIRSITTADALQGIEDILAMTQPTTSPDDIGGPQADSISSAELQALQFQKNEQGELLYQVDAEHRAKVDALYAKKHGTQPQRTVVG